MGPMSDEPLNKSRDSRDLSCIILAAGKGTRMKSDRPKVMHALAGWPLIRHVVATCESLGAGKIVTVIAPPDTNPGMDDVAACVAPHPTAIQKAQMGTGDAARAALPALKGAKGHVLILLGDVPLVTPETLRALWTAGQKTGLAVLAMRMQNPPAYGRLILDADDCVTAIVEERDCTPEQRAIELVNAGAFCVAADRLESWLAALETDNDQGEYYLTDIVAIAARQSVRCAYVTGAPDELMGINSRAQLADAEHEIQSLLRARAMAGGATLIDPLTVWFAADTRIGRDVTIEPGVFFGPGVSIADNVTIHAFTHIEGATIGANAAIGPFARIRPKSSVGEKATIGNFVEVNRAHVKPGAKSKHVSYLGDAVIGEKANIGAGTIIANYDGFDKQETVIGAGVFIGSNSTLVAPLTVGEGAYVAAGSAITTDVPAQALAVARARSVVRDGWATEYRSKKAETRKGKKTHA
ncbi:MAG: bifunctional UDP-N-acetylglucosamine diphosphorylase/glucosamine-1-phosphate N-acetyltransferase GlmU [Rhodospirillales bacterium]|nr:bifunctional UDP-N-acetylglucosamine diphosphorylase/glucosamine-1-phosphate N-acetyltransferase GlmU [Alphaproteobacteria bacterium]MCB9986783.1 bifunctional UDP-N-acetylglucosamine diphosphorylase/glucosamine-1-phosphate N-acetyltransferase GlmU [Rhodospirillales bacterium]USO08588.1 MAG: bifunctional UDP-N-acetylglucosamine diphosphorylase/glucosamine-1-phosphate N-acetyltransferase GlmU [Rhodospirillales bacterium]